MPNADPPTAPAPAASPAGRGVFRAARRIGVYTALSRVLGLVRDILCAMAFGAGYISDAFIIAWTIPNLFRRMFGEGALSSAFLPVFTETHAKEGPGAAWRLLRVIVTQMTAILAAVTVLGIVLTQLLPDWSSALSIEPRAWPLILDLSACLLPYMVFICVAAVLMAALNARGHFDAPAFSPVLLNIVWIAAILLFVPLFGADAAPLAWGGPTAEGQVMAMSVAIVAGGLMQVLCLIPALRREGGSLTPMRSHGNPAAARIWERFTPVVFGLGITQINVVMDRVIAEVFVIGSGAVSALYYGNRLMQFPLAIVGIAVGTAAFPAFASLAVEGKTKTLAGVYRAARRVVLWVGLPAGVGLAVLAEPIVRVLFERGSFGPDATVRTAEVLIWYAATVPLISISQIQTRLLHAFGDTRTPVRVGMWSVLVNIAGNLALVQHMDERGLALATSLSAAFTVWMLGRAVARTRPGTASPLGLGFVGLVGGLSVLMGAICLYLVHATAPAAGLAGVGQLFGYVFAALAVYFGGSRLVGIQRYFAVTEDDEPRPEPAPPSTDSGDAWETEP